VSFRLNRAVAALCIAIIAIAAFLPPGLVSVDADWFELDWVLLPPVEAVATVHAFIAPPEQSLPLFSLLASRAPPYPSFA
jgi:hypothetical protein